MGIDNRLLGAIAMLGSGGLIVACAGWQMLAGFLIGGAVFIGAACLLGAD